MRVITTDNKELYAVDGVIGALEFSVGDEIEVSTLSKGIAPILIPAGKLRILRRIMHVRVTEANGPRLGLTDVTFVVEQIA